MKNTLSRTLACIATATLISLVHGQAPLPASSRVALRVDGLTTDERDLLSADLGRHGDLRVSFACVPAGILILESVDPARSSDSVRAMVTAVLIDHLPADRRREATLTLEQAEELCASAR